MIRSEETDEQRGAISNLGSCLPTFKFSYSFCLVLLVLILSKEENSEKPLTIQGERFIFFGSLGISIFEGILDKRFSYLDDWSDVRSGSGYLEHWVRVSRVYPVT